MGKNGKVEQKNEEQHEKDENILIKEDGFKNNEPLEKANADSGDNKQNSVSDDISGEEVNGKDELKSTSKSEGALKDSLIRLAADFENYKRRMAKEKETTYQDALCEAVLSFLPVLDNFHRAMKAVEISSGDEAMKAGLELVLKQFEEAFGRLGVKAIPGLGEKFNPELHNAVMHVEDPSFSENEIIEEFQKGYMIGEKVVRHGVVKVAN